MKDLKVTVKKVIDHCGAKHKPGDHFFVRGQGRIEIPDNKPFCMYALQSVTSFLLMKQYQDELNVDWIDNTKELACPDAGGIVFDVEIM